MTADLAGSLLANGKVEVAVVAKIVGKRFGGVGVAIANKLNQQSPHLDVHLPDGGVIVRGDN